LRVDLNRGQFYFVFIQRREKREREKWFFFIYFTGKSREK
jgi:hypothetical protein